MKTADEKARTLLDEAGVEGAKFNRLLRLVTLALKEQDRDTRHACAEAVSLLRGQMGEGGDPFCAAHAACMNVKAV